MLVKGGHASGPRSTDILLRSDHETIHFDTPRLAISMRGTGCMLSSAITASLALGISLEKSVRGAKQFVFDALVRSTRSERRRHGTTAAD
ncbi:bifunctional hydroxymethylpyrimidine kinase/phosphomethylpyrimidine kinase [Mesorhizobium tamadayense]|uniref:bifunctional hydroxymethylpyrimidine kinase/phosphomethylpyrimidine kinase n=1 Tax=Mesorhizobium tamadayense TaxID=425306 RepID=UPI00142DB6D0|nr:bifunctional hydroxymethylpyrimidine kinase/phosphomethylpyrimidine kinase [Mesorhizobium tamadayense]